MLKELQVLHFPIDKQRNVSAFVGEHHAKALDICLDQPAQETPWHVLHVHSNFERRVAQHLTVRQVEHYLPLYRERVRWTDRSVVTERPLFSGYVFARFLPGSRIAVISIPGVVRSLGDDAGNLVECAELEKIREGLATGLLLRPHPTISVGARVRIRTGIFEGVEGFVTEFRQRCKVVIALAAVRQCFSLEVELGDVEVLKKPVASVDPAARSAYGY
jgi:transcription antitermination factor NusG